MALSKTITANHQYTNNANSPSSVSFICEASVSGSNLIVPSHIVRPGVFTVGTPAEGYTTNTQPDSNG